MSWEAHAQYLFEKNVLTRSKKESPSKRPADSLEVQISFIFLYVVRIS